MAEATHHLTSIRPADPHASATDRMNDLHRRFDGIIPEELRQIARYGSAEMVALCMAKGKVAEFDHMARGQVRIIRKRRALMDVWPWQRSDLQLYLAQRRKWRVIVTNLERQVDEQITATRASLREPAAA